MTRITSHSFCRLSFVITLNVKYNTLRRYNNFSSNNNNYRQVPVHQVILSLHNRSLPSIKHRDPVNTFSQLLISLKKASRAKLAHSLVYNPLRLYISIIIISPTARDKHKQAPLDRLNKLRCKLANSEVTGRGLIHRPGRQRERRRKRSRRALHGRKESWQGAATAARRRANR